MKKQIVIWVLLPILGALVGHSTAKFYNSCGEDKIPFMKGDYYNDFKFVAGKVRSIHIPKTKNDSFSVEFEGPWFYLSSEDLHIVERDINNSYPKQAMERFLTNEKLFLTYFTNNFKKYGSGWTTGNGVPVTGWQFFGSGPEVNMVNFKDSPVGKFVFIQSSFFVRYSHRSKGSSSGHIIKRSINVVFK